VDRLAALDSVLVAARRAWFNWPIVSHAASERAVFFRRQVKWSELELPLAFLWSTFGRSGQRRTVPMFCPSTSPQRRALIETLNSRHSFFLPPKKMNRIRPITWYRYRYGFGSRTSNPGYIMAFVDDAGHWRGYRLTRCVWENSRRRKSVFSFIFPFLAAY